VREAYVRTASSVNASLLAAERPRRGESKSSQAVRNENNDAEPIPSAEVR